MVGSFPALAARSKGSAFSRPRPGPAMTTPLGRGTSIRGPLRVIAFNTAKGWARDVTEDIARSVLSLAQSEHRAIGIAAQEFLVRVLGVSVPMGD